MTTIRSGRRAGSPMAKERVSSPAIRSLPRRLPNRSGLAGSGVQPMCCWRRPRIIPGECVPRMWSSFGGSGVSFVVRSHELLLAGATALLRPVFTVCTFLSADDTHELANLDRSFWFHASLAAKTQQGYWGPGFPASPSPMETDIRNAAKFEQGGSTDLRCKSVSGGITTLRNCQPSTQSSLAMRSSGGSRRSGHRSQNSRQAMWWALAASWTQTAPVRTVRKVWKTSALT